MVDAAVERYLSENYDRHLAELKTFVRIPSVSALPEHQGDMRRAAEWLADHLKDLGFPTVDIMATGGHPLVYAEWPAPAGKKTTLIYGHYDVQPPDPLDLWESPPFEPTERHDRLYGRGACDDKGNLFMPVKAIEALVKLYGRPPIGIKCLFEGEEEVGSPNLHSFVRDHKELLKADLAICADGGMWGPEDPSLTLSSKGICKVEVHLRTSNVDLHSGQHGAAAPNALERLARLAATLHTPEGKVAVKGFYDDVRVLTAAEREAGKRIPFDETQYAQQLGVDSLWGEPGYSALERRWSRPTIDMNGLWGGFQGAGSKTVTPCEGHLKLTCRLVPNQDPNRILDALEAHLHAHCPSGAKITVHRGAGSARPFEVAMDAPEMKLAGSVLRDIYGKEPLVIRMGGTLPVAETFQHELGINFVFFAWGMPDSQVHAPNESFQLQAFDRARRAHAAYLQALANL